MPARNRNKEKKRLHRRLEEKSRVRWCSLLDFDLLYIHGRYTGSAGCPKCKAEALEALKKEGT